MQGGSRTTGAGPRELAKAVIRLQVPPEGLGCWLAGGEMKMGL